MKILVTMPSGTVGRRITRELLAPEFEVRVLERDPGRLPVEVRGRVEEVVGSMEDPRVLRRALRGIEAFFLCIPESVQAMDLERCSERLVSAAWQATQENGTPRLVVVSAAGKRRASDAGQLGVRRAVEERLHEAGAFVRYLRCGFLMENLLIQARSIGRLGLLSFPLPGHIAIPMVAATDVADAALRWLVRRDWEGVETLEVQGPEALTGIQVAAVIERVLDRPVRYEPLSASAWTERMIREGACPEDVRSLARRFAELSDGLWKPGIPVRKTGMSLSHWIQDELLPVVASEPYGLVESEMLSGR